MNLKKIFTKLKVFQNFFKKKQQKNFYLNEAYKNKITFYKNKIIYSYDDYFIDEKELIKKKIYSK